MLKITLFTPSELKQYYSDNKIMFFTRNALQQLHYSKNAGFYFTKIKTVDNFCRRGTFYAMTPEAANKF